LLESVFPPLLLLLLEALGVFVFPLHPANTNDVMRILTKRYRNDLDRFAFII